MNYTLTSDVDDFLSKINNVSQIPLVLQASEISEVGVDLARTRYGETSTEVKVWQRRKENPLVYILG